MEIIFLITSFPKKINLIAILELKRLTKDELNRWVTSYPCGVDLTKFRDIGLSKEPMLTFRSLLKGGGVAFQGVTTHDLRQCVRIKHKLLIFSEEGAKKGGRGGREANYRRR